MIHVTRHALDRFKERVANVPDDEVRARLSIPAVEFATKFGVPFVRLPTGQRVVVGVDGVVITVLPKDHRVGAMRRRHAEGE